MATFLFDSIVFGPVNSRRLGVSLGINLLPLNRKICNFDCIYCECGLNNTNGPQGKMPKRSEVSAALKLKLEEMSANNTIPDVITFAGNGEPTLHPHFAEIIEDTLELRNQYFPSAKISVLSNATMLQKPKIVAALKKVDQNILKLDSGLEKSIVSLNQPLKKIPIAKLTAQFLQFEGKLIIQSMFTRGIVNGNAMDNTKKEDIEAWTAVIKQVRPEMVMIYTIDRDTPFEGLKKVPLAELNLIAHKITELGIAAQVSG